VRLVVCTHAHVDHCGQAPAIRERTGAPVWLHPAHGHLHANDETPEETIARRVEVARQSGVPEEPLARWAEQRRSMGKGISGALTSDHDLVPGVTVASDLGDWQVVETPGHAPSHFCLHQPERRLLISGDHLLGRVSLFFDEGHTPDPVGEFLEGLDRVDALDARLALAGHGRPFTDVRGHVEANHTLVAESLDGVRAALTAGPGTPYELAQRIYGDALTDMSASWLLALTRSYLTHLERRGAARREPPTEPGGAAIWSS
jgi:glyoxylase-like metal-dependent hydrolase (beta-lactamase superfamily II)